MISIVCQRIRRSRHSERRCACVFRKRRVRLLLRRRLSNDIVTVQVCVLRGHIVQFNRLIIVSQSFVFRPLRHREQTSSSRGRAVIWLVCRRLLAIPIVLRGVALGVGRTQSFSTPCRRPTTTTCETICAALDTTDAADYHRYTHENDDSDGDTTPALSLAMRSKKVLGMEAVAWTAPCGFDLVDGADCCGHGSRSFCRCVCRSCYCPCRLSWYGLALKDVRTPARRGGYELISAPYEPSV